LVAEFKGAALQQHNNSGMKLAVLLGLLTAPIVSLAAKDFVMPKPQPAESYAAHDMHSTEEVGVGVDPYNTAAKQEIFSVHYNDAGLLPVFVVINNNGDQPVSLSGMHAELITADRTKLLPSSTDDIYRRLSRPHAHTSNYPLPFPTKKASGGVNQKTMTEIQNAQFDARAVEPHSTQAGFLFFDVSGMANPLSGSHLYLTGLRDAKGDELMYFEVPLGKD
jgi:hypothetical protein